MTAGTIDWDNQGQWPSWVTEAISLHEPDDGWAVAGAAEATRLTRLLDDNATGRSR